MPVHVELCNDIALCVPMCVPAALILLSGVMQADRFSGIDTR